MRFEGKEWGILLNQQGFSNQIRKNNRPIPFIFYSYSFLTPTCLSDGMAGWHTLVISGCTDCLNFDNMLTRGEGGEHIRYVNVCSHVSVCKCVFCLMQWHSWAEWQCRGKKQTWLSGTFSQLHTWAGVWIGYVPLCVCFNRGMPNSESPWTYSWLLYWHSKAVTSELARVIPQLLIRLPVPMSLLIVCAVIGVCETLVSVTFWSV